MAIFFNIHNICQITKICTTITIHIFMHIKTTCFQSVQTIFIHFIRPFKRFRSSLFPIFVLQSKSLLCFLLSSFTVCYLQIISNLDLVLKSLAFFVSQISLNGNCGLPQFFSINLYISTQIDIFLQFRLCYLLFAIFNLNLF